MEGWEAHARPLAGPLSPRGPQPTVSNRKQVNDGPPWTASYIQGGTIV